MVHSTTDPVPDSDILLVEDREADATLVRSWLSDAYDVEVVADGGRALSLLRSYDNTDAAPELVLLDLNLPRRNGLEILAAARAELPLQQVRFVILSDSQSPTDRERARTLGADRFVTKPMDVADFERTVVEIERSFLDDR